MSYDNMYAELLALINGMWYLKQRLPLKRTYQGAESLFIMACTRDDWQITKKYAVYGRIDDRIIYGFYEYLNKGELIES